MRIPYFSRDTKHKFPFGCIASGEELTFRLILPSDCSRSGVFLIKEDGEETYYPLIKGDPFEEEGFWWTTQIIPEHSGLYFYKFDFVTPFGYNVLTRGIRDEAVISKEGRLWQLTVYDKDFVTPEWLDGGVMYQIFPDRFYNSGIEKKGVPSDRYLYKKWEGIPSFDTTSVTKKLRINNDYWGGDLKGIEQKLDYLSQLGVTCIYLNPIFEAHSNHRYNTADYSKIDPLLGDEDDFKSLCNKAKEHNIHIILDGVFSHTGSDSVYFNRKKRYDSNGAYQDKESPYFPWYSFIKWPEKYDSWWGFLTLPEVNEGNPAYLNYICGEGGIVEKWLKLGADGFRLDVADELPDIFLDTLRCSVKRVKPEAVIIGEVWEDASNKSSYNRRRRYLQGKQLDSVMNYPFYESILRFFENYDGEEFMEDVLNIVENYPPQVLNILMNHLGTHDTERLITALAGESAKGRDRNWQSMQNLSEEQWQNGINLVKMASVLQFTLPGTPCIYYGDEIGTEGYRDPFNRTPFKWDNQNTELLNHYKKLGALRGNPAFASGEFIPYWFSGGYVSFIRKKDNDAVFVAVNLRDCDKVIDLPEYFNNPFAVEGNLQGNQVILSPHSFAIILNN